MIFRIRHAFSCDLHTLFEHMTLFRERGWRFWTLPGWDGKLEPELSSLSILSSWMNALYLLIWSSFKVKSSLWWLRCGALQESHFHLSYLLHQKWRSNPGLGWGNWTKQSSKVQVSGELPKAHVEASNWSKHNLHRFGKWKCRSIGSLFCLVWYPSFRRTNFAAMAGKGTLMSKTWLKSKAFRILINGKPCFY